MTNVHDSNSMDSMILLLVLKVCLYMQRITGRILKSVNNGYLCLMGFICSKFSEISTKLL